MRKEPQSSRGIKHSPARVCSRREGRGLGGREQWLLSSAHGTQVTPAGTSHRRRKRQAGLRAGESRRWLPAQLRSRGCSARHGGSARSSRGLSQARPRTEHEASLPGQGKGAQGSGSARPGPAALRLRLRLKSLPPCAKDGSTPRTCLERSRQCLFLLHQPWCLLFWTKKASRSYFIQADSAFKSLQNFHSLWRYCCVSVVTRLPRRDLLN